MEQLGSIVPLEKTVGSLFNTMRREAGDLLQQLRTSHHTRNPPLWLPLPQDSVIAEV